MARVTSLTWGVKQSFRGYVEMTGGVTEAAEGATRDADGAFIFPATAESTLELAADGALTGRGVFQGEVKFDSHGGMLKVFLADPILEVTEACATLTVADSPKRNFRIEVVKLDPAAAGPDGIPTKLSVDGVYLLGAHYPLNTAVDPVKLA